MALEFRPQQGETVLMQLVWQADQRSEPVAFGVTNQALYLKEKIRGLVRDGVPWRFARVPVGKVRRVEQVRLRPYGWYVLAAVFFVGAVAGFWPIVTGQGGTIYAAHFGALGASLVIPFVARGRTALRVTTDQQTLTFKPPFVVDGASRRKIADVHGAFLAACRKAGVAVTG